MTANEKERSIHPSFPQPSEPSTRVWRFMSLAAFVRILATSSICMPCVEILEDPHERSGSTIVFCTETGVPLLM